MKRSLSLGCLFILGGIQAASAAITISGTVKDTSGNLLDSIRISLSVPGGATLARDTTAANGVFSISSDSTTGKLVLRSTSFGSTSYTTKTDTIVVSGADTAGIVIKMTPTPVPVRTTVIGTIDSAGSAKVLSGAIVTMRSSGGGGGATLRDTTGADGKYSFANVTTGVYTISVSATGYTTTSVTDTVTAAPDTANVSLVAIVSTTVSGKVDSAGSATLISGAVVTLRGTGGGAASVRDTTGADGLYSFANVTTGVYTISVAATGYTTANVNDTVTAAPNTVNVSLVAIVSSTVSGKVDSAGSAKLISGAIVTLRGTGAGAASVRDTTGADGLYSFANVTAGVYTISVAATGYTTGSVTDTVTAAPDTVNVSLVAVVPAKTITISGTITDSTGKKLESIYVSYRSTGAGASTLMRDTTGADGSFSFVTTNLTGNYVLRLINLKSTKDTLVDSIALDSVNLDVKIVWNTSMSSGVEKNLTGLKAGQHIWLANGILNLGFMNTSGSVRLFNAEGKLLVNKSFQPSANVSMPIGRKLSTGNYILRITQNDVVLQKHIVVQ